MRERAGLSGADVLREYHVIRENVPDMDLRASVGEKAWLSRFESGTDGHYSRAPN